MFSKSRITIAAALVASMFTAHAATIEITGEVLQDAQLVGSPVTALAVGPGAEAHANVNVVQGDVRLRAGLTQRADLRYSPVSAGAFGAFAKATARVNALVN